MALCCLGHSDFGAVSLEKRLVDYPATFISSVSSSRFLPSDTTLRAKTSQELEATPKPTHIVRNKMASILDKFTRPSSRLATTWSSSSQSCLGRLPDETWSECFLWLHVQDIYAISQTCRRLRRIAIASSRLWATATLTCQSNFRTMAVRSRDVPLHVQLARDFVPSEHSLRFCAPRLRELSLVLRWNRAVDWSVLLNVPMPMLDTLRVRSGVFDTFTTPTIPLHWGRDYVPHLRVLRLPSVLLATPPSSSPTDDHGPFSRLEELDVCLLRDDDLVMFLRHSPNLRTLRVSFQKHIPGISATDIPVSLRQASFLCPHPEGGRRVSFAAVAHWPVRSIRSLSISSAAIVIPRLSLPWGLDEEDRPLALDVRWAWNGESEYGNSTVAVAWDDETEQHVVYLQCATTPETAGPDLNALKQPGFAARFTSMNIDPRILVQLVRQGASLPEVTSLTVTLHYDCIRENQPHLRIHRDFMIPRLLAEGVEDASGKMVASMLHLPQLSQLAVNFTGSFPKFLSPETIQRGTGFIQERFPATLDGRIEITNALECLSINIPTQLCESPDRLYDIYYGLRRIAVRYVDLCAYDSQRVELYGGEWQDPSNATSEEPEFIPALRD